MELKDFVKDGVLKVVVKPNCNKTEFLGLDKSRRLPKIALKAPPDKGKANKELINFVSKQLGDRFRIVSGLTSKEKVLRIV